MWTVKECLFGLCLVSKNVKVKKGSGKGMVFFGFWCDFFVGWLVVKTPFFYFFIRDLWPWLSHPCPIIITTHTHTLFTFFFIIFEFLGSLNLSLCIYIFCHLLLTAVSGRFLFELANHVSHYTATNSCLLMLL